jgi:hypothetical protein
MAAFTITTSAFLRDLTGKTGADSYTINGGSLTIDCDSRYAPNSLFGGQPVGGTLGDVSVSSVYGGHWQVTTEFTRLIPFANGSGNVPTYGAIVTQGGAAAVLLCVMETATGGATYAGGTAMPANGWLKVRVNTAGFTAGALTGIGCDATGPEQQGWIVVVGEETRSNSHARLGTMQFRGDWLPVGTTTGAAGQTIQLPHFSADGRTDYPGIEVETAPGSEEYQFWPNLGTRFTSINCSTDTRSMFVGISTTGLVTFGTGLDALPAGYVPPAGCAVRIPSIITANCTTTNRLVNCEPSRTMGSRYESSFTNAGSFDVRCVTGAWYWNVVQPYNVYIRDLHVCDNIQLGECATAMDIDGLHQGLATSPTDYGSSGILIQQSYNGGVIGSMSWVRASSTTTSAHAATLVNLYGGWTAAKLRGGHAGPVPSLSSSLYLNTNGPFEIDEVWTFTKRVLIQAGDHVKINRHVYADNCVGTTGTVAQSRAIEVMGQSNTVDVTNIENWPGVPNCHPYLALLYTNTTQKATLRNCGTAAAPYNAGTVNVMAYLWDDGGNNDTIKVQRNWTTALRLGLFGGFNTTTRFTGVNNYQVDASKTIGPQQLDALVHGNRFNSGGVPGVYSSVYGNCMWDGFTGDTTTRAALILVEKSAANPDAYQITAGNPKFTGAGRIVMAAVGDQIEWTWPWRILGWTGLTSMALTGANTGNHQIDYALDKDGTGFGAWKTLTNANLLAETGIDPVVGFVLKMRATCTVANTANRIDSLRVDGTTTLALQNAALYPLDTAKLTLTGLQAGSSVAVFAGVPTPGQAPLTLLENSPTSAVMSYDYDPLLATCTVRIRKPGFGPIDLTYANTVEAGIPVSQVENKDGFGEAIYGRGQGTTDAFVTADGPALRVDIGNQLCVAEDVYDVLAAWQATATGMRYPEVMRFDGRDLLLMGSWRLRRALAAYTSAGIDAAVVIDGMPTASPDDEVNGSVDIRAKAVRTYSTSVQTPITPADFWNFTLSTGNTAESELLAAKTAASNAFAVSA